jgi:4-hydroxy-2-oxoheptanedioate aldolase
MNQLKADLARGEIRTGLWLALANPTTAAIAAGAGYDWCLIDGEHGPNTVQSALAQAQAIEGRGAACVARVTENRADLIKQMLDIGIQTLLIPMVETAQDAEAAVAACRYPPAGIRGSGALLGRAADYGAIIDYTQTADAEICVLVQVESRRGLENLDAILGVEGVDGVFIGPADLAADMGHPGQLDAPDVTAAIEDALPRIRASGKAPGIVSFKIDSLARYVELGVTFLGVGGDATTYASAVRGLSNDANAAIGRR